MHLLRLALIFLSAAAFSLQAQTLKGTILGTVSDASGAVIPAARALVTETGTNVRRTLLANESGLYVAANLDPGTYRVEVEHSGFRRLVRDNIELPPNNTVRVDMQLTPGAISESIEVTTAAPILKTDRTDTGGQLETETLQNMPMGYARNYQTILQTIPGVSHWFRTHSEFYNSQDSLTGYTNGQGSASNNFQIEGIDNNLENSDLTGIIPPIEALQTVEVSTTNYDPELGRAGGSVTNLTIRSGTNDFHGSAFEFNKSGKLQAADVFATARPPLVFNQFGGTIGGPIKKNKIFFFADYQGDRDHKGVTDLVTIPNTPFRSGDFSKSPTVIYDPTTGDGSGRSRTPFPNQRIPSSQLSPVAQRLLALIAPPTRPGDASNFEKASVRVKTLDQVDSKVDYVLTNNDRLMTRYSYQGAYVADPGLYGPNNGIYGGPHNTGYEGTGPARTQSLGLNYSRVWSPTLVMEIRGGVLRNHNSALPWDWGTTAAKDIGIPGANLDLWSSGLSGINVNGYTTPMIGTRGDIPWVRGNTNISFTNNWTKTARTHVIKFGYDLRRYRRDLQQTTAGPRGLFTFGQGPTSLNGGPVAGYANSFASFVLDRPTTIAQSRPVVFPAQRDWLHALYFQDKWQVISRLTLDVGLRWDYWPASKPANPGGFANYNWTNNTIELAGLGNIPMDLGVVSPKRSFGPRVGFAYRINSKTVFRGGYGISYQTRALNGSGNFPVKQESTYNPPNSFSAAGSMAAGVPVPSIATFPANGIISPAPPSVTASVLKKDAPFPYVQSWNVSLQRALPGNFVLEAAFVGNHAINQNLNWNYNSVQQLGCGAACQPFNALYGRTAAVNIGIGVHQYYDALQVKFDHRFHDGFMLTTAYTYSKTIDFSSRQTFNLLLDKGRSNNDITHVFVQSYLYQLPFGQGKRWGKSGASRALLGDWQINGIFTSQTGFPLNFTYSATTLNAPGQNNQPNLVGTGAPAILGGLGPGQYYFDVTRFAAPPALTFGNMGRNILSGPGLLSLDLSLFRTFKMRERISLQVRAETLNFTNTPHFGNPGTTFGNAGFGQVTTSNGFTDSTNDTVQRKIQFGIRLFF